MDDILVDDSSLFFMGYTKHFSCHQHLLDQACDDGLCVLVVRR